MIDCTKIGYQPSHTIMQSHFEGMTAGNLILGGVIGIGVDAASGAMNHYDKQVSITMLPEGTVPTPVVQSITPASNNDKPTG